MTPMVADATHATQDGIPLTLLTGFLGAGKTTLLAHVLRGPDAARIAVLVNDVDGVALDHPLLERLPDEALQLTSGCLCCAGRLGLADALARLLAHGPERIVLELAGSADPAPILHALATDERLRALVAPAGVVSVVDVARAWLHHGAHAASFTTRVAHVAAAAREDVLQLWLRLVTQLDGERLPRVKLIAECAATGGAFVLQSVGATVSPARRLARRPAGLRGVHALFVARGLPETTLASMLDALSAAVAGTRAAASGVAAGA